MVLKNPETEDEISWTWKVASLDFGGAFTLILTVAFLLFALDQGSNISWNSPLTTCCLLASALLLLVFLVIEWKLTSQPFLPARILYQPSLFACSICNLLAYAGWLGITYYLPLYWQAVEGLSATQTALRLLPGTVAGVAGSLLAGWKMRRTGKYYSLTVIAYAICVLGVIPIMLFTGLISHNIWGIWLGTIFCSFFSNVGATTTLIAQSRLKSTIFVPGRISDNRHYSISC